MTTVVELSSIWVPTEFTPSQIVRVFKIHFYFFIFFHSRVSVILDHQSMLFSNTFRPSSITSKLFHVWIFILEFSVNLKRTPSNKNITFRKRWWPWIISTGFRQKFFLRVLCGSFVPEVFWWWTSSLLMASRIWQLVDCSFEFWSFFFSLPDQL